MARGPLGPRGFSLCCRFVFLFFFPCKVVAGVGGPADLFLFYLLRDCWRGAIIQSLDQPVWYNPRKKRERNDKPSFPFPQ